MKTQNFIKNNLKSAALLLFAAAMTNGFTACDSELEDVDRPSKEAPAEEPHSNAIGSYDDLAILLNTIAETDNMGKVTNRYYGKPLDDNDPTHLYIGVDELQEAKDMFLVWLAPDDIDHPATLSEEHQKYINEVLPRMAAEAETGNWETVDEYTDRLLQYQRTFSATTPIRQAGGSTTTILAGFLLLLFIASARTSCSGRSRG